VSSAAGLRSAGVAPRWRGTLSSPGCRGRLAAILYFAAVAVAVYFEFIASGAMGIVSIALPVACSAAATLLLCSIFWTINPRTVVVAAIINLISLAFESLEVHPFGFHLAMVLHGVYAVLLGWLMLRSRALPRTLAAMMAFAGLVWLVYLVPPVAKAISPWNTAVGLLCEAAPMLWILAMGVRPTVFLHAEEAPQ
jgi:hypothetical protein